MSGFVKVKTQDLSGSALDWAVAKAEGLDVTVASCTPPGETTRHYAYVRCPYKPSRSWDHGGPLIEKYMIGFGLYENSLLAVTGHNDFSGSEHGETHLIAACRAIVAARIGDEVAVPEVLA
jgi:hypothetical protein